MENSGISCCVAHLKSNIVLEEHVISIFKWLAGSAYYLLHAGFLLGVFFDLENGGDMFLRNIN
jgi:hypothetical protein